MKTVNEYRDSDIFQTLKNAPKKRIAFFDIDSTMTGDPVIADKTRKLLEANDYAIVFVTTRTEEMLMSHSAYTKSIANKTFHRPRPNLQSVNGMFNYIQPEEYEPIAILDPEIIVGSTGTQILIRHEDKNYVVDSAYEKSFIHEKKQWKQMTMQLLRIIDPEAQLYELPMIDRLDQFEKSFADVAPPNYRLGLHFKKLRDKAVFLKELSAIRTQDAIAQDLKDHANAITVINDSHPIHDRYKLYLVPKDTSKEKAVEHIIQKLSETLGVERSAFEIIIAGDSLPDLDMGLHGGKGTKATFILVGGSRLTDVIRSKTEHSFAGVDLSEVKQSLQEISPGRFRYVSDDDSREFIICDAFSNKHTEVASLYAYLQMHFEDTI